MGAPIRIAAVTLAGLLAAAAGCGGEEAVDTAQIEAGIERQLSTPSVKATSANCPDDVKSEEGATFTCKVKFDNGATGKATVTQESADGFTYALKPGSVTVPGETADAAVEQSLAGQGAPDATVECPDPVAVKVDTTVTCSVTGAGGAVGGTITYEFTDAYGTVDPGSVEVEEPA